MFANREKMIKVDPYQRMVNVEPEGYFVRVVLRNPAKLIRPKPKRIMAGSSPMKNGSGVYNLAKPYKAGGANSMMESSARNRRIDFLVFKIASGNGNSSIVKFQ